MNSKKVIDSKIREIIEELYPEGTNREDIDLAEVIGVLEEVAIEDAKRGDLALLIRLTSEYERYEKYHSEYRRKVEGRYWDI